MSDEIKGFMRPAPKAPEGDQPCECKCCGMKWTVKMPVYLIDGTIKYDYCSACPASHNH